MAENADKYPVGNQMADPMCKCLKVGRNTYYEWKRKQEVPTMESKVEKLKERIREIWGGSRRLYGSPKITEMLKREGLLYSTSYVARLMGK